MTSLHITLILPWIVSLSLLPHAIAAEPQEPGRTWVSSDGKHRTEASFVAVQDYQVHLLTTAGKEVVVPVTSLSVADGEYVEKMAKRASEPSAELLEMVRRFEEAKEWHIVDIHQRSSMEAPKRPKTHDEGEIVRRNEEIFGPLRAQGINIPGPRDDIEAARAQSAGPRAQYAGALKTHEAKFDKELENANRRFFIPSYGAEKVIQMSSLSHYAMIHNLIRKNDGTHTTEDLERAEREHRPVTGMPSIGRYLLMPTVISVLDKKHVRARIKHQDSDGDESSAVVILVSREQ